MSFALVTRFLHVFNFKGSPRLLKISKKTIGFKKASQQLFFWFHEIHFPLELDFDIVMKRVVGLVASSGTNQSYELIRSTQVLA